MAVQWVQFWVNIGRSPRTEPVQWVQFMVNIGCSPRTEPDQWIQFLVNIGCSPRTEPVQRVQFWVNIGRYDGVSAVIGVQHIEVPNLLIVSQFLNSTINSYSCCV